MNQINYEIVNSFYVNFKMKQEKNKQETLKENNELIKLLPLKKTQTLLPYYDINPGRQQVESLTLAFKHYNAELFDNALGQVVIYFVREIGNVLGHYRREAWSLNSSSLDEIVIYASCLNMGDLKTHLILVHEMTHLWEQLSGERQRRLGYHTKAFEKKMDTMGLKTTYSTSRTSADTKGYNPDSAFDKAYKAWIGKLANISTESSEPYVPKTTPQQEIEQKKIQKEQERGKNAGTRIKYVCPCKNKVWGKRGLEIRCLECGDLFKGE